MKITIIEPGWAGYTGHFGLVEFANGTSVDDVSRAEAAYLAGIVAIETDEGKNPSSTQALLDAHTDEAPVVALPAFIPEAPKVAKFYTADELAAVADQGGIKAVRAIAEPLGLKDNSIAELMAKILDHQAKAALAAAAAA